MTRLVFIFTLTLMFVLPSHAKDEQPDDAFNRKALMKEVKASLKSKNYSQADNQIKQAKEKYAEASQDAEINNIHMNVVHHLAEAENRKIFLNNKPDTTAFLNQIYRVYQLGILCDSIDVQPDKKGRIRPRYTENIKERLQFYRRNMRSAGIYFYKKQNYKDALRFIDMYIGTKDSPLIANNDTAQERNIYSLAVFSAYGAENYTAVKTYLPMCKDDTTHTSLLHQIASKTYMATGDTLTALTYLQSGWEKDPMKDYFYLTLIHYYIDHNEYDEALAVINSQLDREPENAQLWYIKGKCLQCEEQWDEAIHAYEQALYINDDNAEALSSMGEIYVTQAHDAYHSNKAKVGTKQYQQSRKKQTQLYTKAMEVLEKARAIKPDETKLWLTNLSEAYYKLNKGKELKELEKLLQ